MDQQDIFQQPVVVFDQGSCIFKAGLGGEDKPKTCFPCLFGKPKTMPLMLGNPVRIIGERVQALRGLLKVINPINQGIIVDWEVIEEIWHYSYFDKLSCSPDEHPLLITEAPLNSKENKEKMAQILFETFYVPHLSVKMQAPLSLYASGRTTGIVLDSGDTVTSAIPIFEGQAMLDSMMKSDFAGQYLTDYLVKLLQEEVVGQPLLLRERLAIVGVKEKLCYVAQDFDKELKKLKVPPNVEIRYALPDGKFITVGDQLFRCPEILFQPEVCRKGIHELVYEAINKCDVSKRAEFFGNILLAGGTTMLDGFETRFREEISRLVPAGTEVKVEASADRQLSAWIGGSMLTRLRSFQFQGVTKAEYEESGPMIVHKKCT